MPAKRLDRAFKAIVGGIFLPARAATPTRLSIAAWVIIALGLTAPLILAEPHIKDATFCRIFTAPSPEGKDRIKNFCDYIAICAQIFIAMAIGGVAFTDRIVQRIQAQAAIAQSRSLKSLDSRQKYFVRQVIKTYVDIRYAGKGLTFVNFLRRSTNITNDIWHTYRLMFGGRLYNFYILLILTRVGAAFPGGFYGVLAFVSFEGLIFAQTIKTYFEYAPYCG